MNNIELIENFCLKEDLSTFDPYDIWKTRLGLWVKIGFYKHKQIYAPIAVLLTLLDYINNKYRLFYTPQEYPIVRALAALSLINLYKSKKDYNYLIHIKKHVEWLLKNTIANSRGIGWGLGFKWPVTEKIYYSASTPFSTHTPYAFEAIYQLNEIEPDQKYDSIFIAIYEFFEHDIQIMFEDETSLAISYGPLKDRIATNATSYGLLLYSYFSILFPDQTTYLSKKAKKMYKFIKNNQGKSGEWFYSPTPNSFIDCFHSCFILQNLIKAKRVFKDMIEEEVILNGWNYIKTNFYDSNSKLYKRFAVKNKPSIIKYDLYDNAEVLNTSILLGDRQTTEDIIQSIYNNFVEDNSIYSTISILNTKQNKNMLRWAVMPFIFAISLYSSGKNKNK